MQKTTGRAGGNIIAEPCLMVGVFSGDLPDRVPSGERIRCLVACGARQVDCRKAVAAGSGSILLFAVRFRMAGQRTPLEWLGDIVFYLCYAVAGAAGLQWLVIGCVMAGLGFLAMLVDGPHTNWRVLRRRCRFVPSEIFEGMPLFGTPCFLSSRAWKSPLPASNSGPTPRRAESDFLSAYQHEMDTLPPIRDMTQAPGKIRFFRIGALTLLSLKPGAGAVPDQAGNVLWSPDLLRTIRPPTCRACRW